MERVLYDLAYRLVMFDSRGRRIQMDYHVYFEPSCSYSILEIERKARELHDQLKDDARKKFGLAVERLERKEDLPKRIEIKKEEGELIFTNAGVILKNMNVYKV